MEPARDDCDHPASFVHRRRELTHAGSRLDASLHARERSGGYAFKRGNPRAQTRREVDLAAHGRLCGALNLITSTGFVSEQLDHLIADEGGISIQDDEETRRGHANERSALVTARSARPCPPR